MRSRFALVALLVLVPVLALQAGSAGARPSRAASTWHYIHFHINAYSPWGGCTAEWHASGGTCRGVIEKGVFSGRSYDRQSVEFTWKEHRILKVSFGPKGHEKEWDTLSGTKPHNWYTFAVHTSQIKIEGATFDGETGTNTKVGHEGGPLFVDLSSHSTGYSFAFYGYLRAK